MRREIGIYALIPMLFLGCADNPALRSPEEFDQPVVAKARGACDPQWAEPILLSHHVLISDSEGNIPTGRHHGSFSEAFRTIMLGYADAVHRNSARPPRLLFYFNGGLNSQASVEEQAARQLPCMLADGYYPVFFIWDTDGLGSYWEQVSSIWDGQVDRSFSTRARTPLMVIGNVVSGLGRAPADYFIHGRRFTRAIRRVPVCSMIVRKEADPEIAEELKKCPQEQRVTFVDEVGGALGPEDPERKTANVVAEPDTDEHQLEVRKFLTYSLLWPVRIVSTPLAHGIGEAGWTNMLRRTRTTINRSMEFNLNRNVDGTNKCPEAFREDMKNYPKGTGAFARFFETTLHYYKGWKLPPSEWRCEGDQEIRADPPTPEQEHEEMRIREALARAQITMIGHSMGAIVINALLDRFPDLPYTDIVVMASAANLRETRRVLNRFFEDDVNHSKMHANTYFYSLMLHPLNDARERSWGGAVPSGSLLMWIDEMYDLPKTPEDKVFGFWPTAKAGRRMFGRAAQEQMLYRVFSRPQADKGKPTNPIEHGQFNEDDTCFWRPSFWGITDTTWEARYEAVFPEHVLRRCREEHDEPLPNETPPAGKTSGGA